MFVLLIILRFISFVNYPDLNWPLLRELKAELRLNKRE